MRLARFALIIGIVGALPLVTYAAGSIDINTASASTLETLPGIGASKAAAIVEYRSLHGPFGNVEAIQEVSGIGPSTYANIASLITVSGGAVSTPAKDSATASSTDAADPVSRASSPSAPPQDISVDMQMPGAGFANVPLSFSAQVKKKNGSADTAADLFWNFGDGSTQEGSPVTKTYWYPGTYRVAVDAHDGSAEDVESFTVTIAPVAISIEEVTSAGVTIRNDSDTELDLSGWQLYAQGSSFRFPAGSWILPKSEVLFPQSVTHLPVAESAYLTFPNGRIATRYAGAPGAETSVQLAEPSARYSSMKAVETVSRVMQSAHENTAVVAPRGLAEVPSPRGAPVTATTTPKVAPDFSNALSADAAASVTQDGPLAGLLHSTWMLGLLGVITVAGGAFLIL